MRTRTALRVAVLLVGCARPPPLAEPPTPPAARAATATPEQAEAAVSPVAPVAQDAGATASLAGPDAQPVAAAGPDGCMRRRESFAYRCSGMAPAPGEPNTHPVMACDRCLADADCKEQPGGRCVRVGGTACRGPSQLECRYPSAKCGGEICPERPPAMPPSMRRP